MRGSLSDQQFQTVGTSSPAPEKRASGARTAKHCLDLVGAGIALIVLAPVFAIVALSVKLADGGPIFYRRRVVGLTGEFDALKFRTMRVDADRVLQQNVELREAFEKNFKLPHDPRITKLGSFLRKYSLDEIPQFVNVLRGEMSLVGPRMITSAELEKYGEQQDLVRSVRPGISGYWQVNGRQRKTYAERVEMDLFYIQNWSFLLDIKILLKTPFKVLKGEGAY